MADENTLLGVVAPTTVELEVEIPPGLYENAHEVVVRNLEATRRCLTAMRAERDRLNDEIRRLVEDVDLLERMARITRREQTNDR